MKEGRIEHIRSPSEKKWMAKIIAHPGFPSRAPENTMAVFKTALEFGVDGLELDVHLSRDGEVVVCHDERVDRTTNGRGFIKDLTWPELQKLDVGSWFHPLENSL